MIDRSSPDEVLADMARAGDMSAFEELFTRYKKPILNFIYRIIGNRETAEEVAQEAFMKTYNNLDIFDTNKKFSTWIYTIARNLAKNSLRDRKYFRDISLESDVSGGDDELKLKDMLADPNAGPKDIAESKELAEEAQKILDSLPLECREVVALCSIQGMVYKEAAAILGVSIATVSMRLNEAKKLFMKRLGMAYSEGEEGDKR